MKFSVFSRLALVAAVAATATIANAQLTLPRASQRSSVMQTIGITDLTITYSRPGVKGRKIFGEAPKDTYAEGEATLDNQYKRPEGMAIVPYGHMWRTGANEATQFVITNDCMINGKALPAGNYSLHTIPGKGEWTLVFNDTENQWGSFNYDASKDKLRVTAKPMESPHSQEWLLFTIDPVTENSATVNILWEKVWVPFTVTVDTVGIAMTKARPMVAAAKADDWRTRYNVGTYAMDNGLTEEGTKLLTEALGIVDGMIKEKESYQNLAARANILFSLRRMDDAFAAAETALARGKADKADTAALQNRVDSNRAKKN